MPSACHAWVPQSTLAPDLELPQTDDPLGAVVPVPVSVPVPVPVRYRNQVRGLHPERIVECGIQPGKARRGVSRRCSCRTWVQQLAQVVQACGVGMHGGGQRYDA